MNRRTSDSTGIATTAALAVAVAAVVVPATANAEPVTLDEVLEQVSTEHETREITEQQIRESRAFRRQALAGLLPQLNASANVTRQGGEEVEIGDRTVRRRYEWGVDVVGSLTVFDGPQYFDYWAADARLDATRHRARWQRHLLELEAELAFYTLASSEREVDIAEAAVDWRREHLENTEAMVDAGLAVPTDASRARAEVLEAEQTLVEARAQLGDAADGLATLMGRSPDGELRADIDPGAIDPETPQKTRAVEIDDHRADFAGRMSTIEASQLGHRGIWWSLAPQVAIQLSSNWGPTSLFNPDGHSWAMTLSASWNLYDGGGRYARADAAQAEIRQLELELERDLREADVELASAYRNWRSAVAAIEVAEQRLEVAEETYEQMVARFENGLVSSLEVADASQELLNAELRLNQVMLQARLAEVQYRYLREEDR